MTKKIFFFALMLGTSVSTAFAKVNVVATLPWIGSIAREIGRDQVSVNVLVKPNQDAHYVEAKPSMILAASKADVVMYNGLDLEVGYLPLIVTQSRNSKIQPGQRGNLDCSRYIDPIERPHGEIDRSMGDVHPFGNPHYHFSPRRVLAVAEGMAGVLSDLDPSHAAAYKSNQSVFREKVQARQKAWGALTIRGKRFVAYHKIFEYLADDFGFTITGYVEPKPGIPPSAGYIERLIEKTRESRPNGILTTSIYGRKEVDFLAQKTGVRGVVLPHDVGATPGAKDWFSFMDEALSALVK
jgi:zinc/manganese transport system substrate-binding protein